MPDLAGDGPLEQRLDPLDVARQAELLELTQDAILVRDLRTSAVSYWNRGAERLYGWSRAEALDQVSHELLRTRLPVSLATLNEALVRDGYWEGELVHSRRDGSDVVVSSRQAVQHDPLGQPVAILEINTDITQRRLAEDERVRRAAEQRARELAERAVDRLSRLQAVRIALSQALMPAEVGAVVMDQGIDALGARAGAICLLIEDTEDVELVAVAGYSDAIGQQYQRFSLTEPLPVNDVLRSGEPLFLSSYAEVQQRYSRLPEPEIRGAIAVVPLFVNNGVTGAMSLSFEGPHVFEHDDQELLIALAIQCAQALERARLFELAMTTQEDLRRSRDQLAAILAGIAEGVTVQDARGQLIYANDVAAHMTGFPSASAFLEAPMAEIVERYALFDEAGEPLTFDHLPGRRLLLGEAASELVIQFRDRRTGEGRWTILDATPVTDDQGRLQLIVNIFRDITERKRQADATAFLAEASSVLSSSLDTDTGLVHVARLAVSSVADWCIVDLVQDDRRLRRLVVAHRDPDRVDEAEALRRQNPTETAVGAVGMALGTGRSELVEDESHSWIATPMRVRAGVLGIISVATTESGRHFRRADVSVFQDLAARAALAMDNARLFREAQEQVEHQAALNAALRSTIDERDRALVDVQQALRTRDEFLAAASHDLKNPLASIKATAQLIQRRLDRGGAPDIGRLREGLQRMDAVATRAAGQVEELLDLARMQMGRPLDLERRPMDLVALVREAIAEQQQATERHTLRLESEESELVGVWDPTRLGRVLANLLENAIKYSPYGGAITVRVDREGGSAGDFAILEIRDSGIGIPADDVERIFERFQRASNVEGRVSGTGIGLASALHIVESHGGSIAAESQEHAGSVFRVRLPLGHDDALSEA